MLMTPPSISILKIFQMVIIITTEWNKIDVWLKHNKLSLNVEKTKYMTFHTSQNYIKLLPLLIDGKLIENVKYSKFLCILFD